MNSSVAKWAGKSCVALRSALYMLCLLPRPVLCLLLRVCAVPAVASLGMCCACCPRRNMLLGTELGLLHELVIDESVATKKEPGPLRQLLDLRDRRKAVCGLHQVRIGGIGRREHGQEVGGWAPGWGCTDSR